MTKRERTFVDTVWNFYRAHGRHDLPWRTIPIDADGVMDPYRILVSEVMLQQTQVSRVIQKYTAFLESFPNVDVLSSASVGSVLRAWQGLGYNRRAKLLHQCAQTVVEHYDGVFPRDREQLAKLPGIGPYTAGAIMAFAYNEPVVLIETNVRTVYLHHFFKTKSEVIDSEIRPFIERTMDHEHPRTWYAALMDYGAYLKQTIGNPNTQSKHYTKQSRFVGSDRQIRGAILRAAAKQAVDTKTLPDELQAFARSRLTKQLAALVSEDMLVKRGNTYHLP